jgi:hypothetical protein
MIANIPVMLLPPSTSGVKEYSGVKNVIGEAGISKGNNGGNNSPGHPLLCTYLRDVMKGEEPLDFSLSSVSVSNSHISVPQDSTVRTESTSKIKASTSAPGEKAEASKISKLSSKRVTHGGEYSSNDGIHQIITEQVVKNSNKKDKKSREEILLKFSSIDDLNVSIIRGLMSDPENLKGDLLIYFKEALKKLFQFDKGTVPIGDEIGIDEKVKQVTRAFSSCTSTQLGHYLIELIIKKRGASKT